MRKLRDFTIKQKLLIITMVTIAASLLLAGTGIVISDSILFRSAMRSDVAALASIVGDNSTAALAFEDPKVALDVLSALKARPHMESACIYKPNGSLFAKYSRAGAGFSCIPPAPDEQVQFANGSLLVSHPIVLDQRRVGTLVMIYDLGEAEERTRLYVMMVLGILLASSLVAFLVSAKLRELIATPISRLAKAAASVSQTGDYGVRVEKYSEDEIGVCADAFNSMLDRVQSRDSEIQSARNSLEITLAELQESAQRLKEADRRKDEFLAMLAHELRNPLAPIRNAVHVLRTASPLDDKQQWAARVIERQSQQLAHLVDDLLDVSRITRGKITLQKERLALSTIVQNGVETSRPIIEARKQNLTVSLPGEPIHVMGDATRLIQVIGNLLNNAAKFTGEGGIIRLEVTREDNQAVIRVTDNGVGLPPELVPHVFDLFTQADRSLDRTQGGLGIGLTVVRNLIELHGGQVEAHSEGTGRGSTFIVRLPALDRDAAESRAHDSPETCDPAHGRLRILVLEDNVDSAEMLRFMLELDGHEVRTLYDGGAALEAANTFKPQIVLCDIGLPKVNGYQVAINLRRTPAFRTTPLVAISGYGQEEDRRRSKEAGFDYHLTKPVEPDMLLAVLKAVQPT